MVDAQLSTRLKDSIQIDFWSYTAEFEKKLKEAAASLTEFELKKILLDKVQKSKPYRWAQEHKELYDGLVKSYKLDKDLFKSYGKAYSLKRDSEDKDKDEDPSAGSDQRWKRRKTIKDVKPSKVSKSKESKSSSSKGTKSQPKSSALKHDWFKKLERPSTPDSDWNANKTNDCRPSQTWIRQEYPFDLSKPLLLIDDRGRQVVPVNYFINNDIEYLKGGSSSRKYTTSKTKTKTAKEDQKLYKFKEGDFPRLNLRDIEDMLLLLVQKKITNLKKDFIFDLNVALRMFTRRVVILKRAKDLQLGVKSYQKKLNTTRPETFNKFKRNRLMRLDEFYNFSDGTLTSVRYVLHDIASNMRIDYLPKRRCSTLGKQRSHIMIKAIDKLQLKRRLMWNLEKFVGGREYRE
ncbi:hypothetical protein Tco_0412659 [Tanacetum coccineum]